jgi:predicted transport protein
MRYPVAGESLTTRAHNTDGERRLSPADIRTMLGRIGKGLLPTDEVPPAVTAVAATASPSKSTKGEGEARRGPVRERNYSYEEHFGDKPQVIVDLYTQLHERIVGLSSDIERMVRKQYVGYRIGKKVFCRVIPQKQRLRLILNIDPALVAGHSLGRDVTGVALGRRQHRDDARQRGKSCRRAPLGRRGGKGGYSDVTHHHW